MKKALKFLEKVAAASAVFFLPSQLALHFWPDNAFIFGIRVDFLSPAIYFSDVLIFLLLILFFVNSRKLLITFVSKNLKWFVLLIAIFLINSISSTFPGITIYKWSKYFEYIFFGLYFYLRKDFLGEKNILKVFLSSSVLISLVGIFQFFLHRTTGAFYFLGERTFSITTPGIALTTINGQNFLRAYSIFSHPNSMAGYLSLVFLLFIFSKILKRRMIWYLSLVLIIFAFALTFSLSAYIAVGMLLVFYLLKNFRILNRRLMIMFLFLTSISSLALPIFSEKLINNLSLPQNIEQRLELSYVSGKMLTEKFMVGEGLNTFIVNSIRFKNVNVYGWLLQPVHNIYLLTITETGIIGLLTLIYFLNRIISLSFKSQNWFLIAALFVVLFTGLSDHYWLTLQQNPLLISFLVAMSHDA